MRSVNRIHGVIDRGVQDRKAPRRMDRGRLRSGRADDRKKCSIPLQNWVDWLRGRDLRTQLFRGHGGAAGADRLYQKSGAQNC
jgi:hypothetical protein